MESPNYRQSMAEIPSPTKFFNRQSLAFDIRLEASTCNLCILLTD